MLSVIIPTRDRAGLLHSALSSIAKQSLDPSLFEVLVIDNGSADHTRQVTAEFANQTIDLRYLMEPEPGLHAGRHRGLAEARGEVLLFADDDIEAGEGWLKAIEMTFRNPQVAMAGGNNLPLFEVQPPRWLIRLWQSSRVDNGRALGALSILELSGPERALDPGLVWGCNFAIRKSVLLDAGGFHPDAMPADLIRFRGDGETHVSRFVANSGLLCMFNPDASVRHRVPAERMTYEYFQKRGFNQGVSDSYTELRGEDIETQNQDTFAKKAFHSAIRRIRRALLRDSGARHALRQFEAGHKEGYAFHQAVFDSDPEVREWVHKSHYFDE